MASKLLELSTIIAEAVTSLDNICLNNGTPIPGFEDPYSPSSEAFRSNPQAAEAANTIAAAAAQLVAMVLPPPVAMFSLIAGHFKSAALRVCLETNVTEILREGGPQGVHVDNIAKISNIDSDKIARLLRYLATHHVYKELRPNVFTNTRISSTFDTGKSVNKILADPDKKYDNSLGKFAALAGFQLDEVAKACAHLWENMSDPAVAHSEDVNHSPFSRAFNWDGSLWSFLSQPEQWARQHRFGIGMQGFNAALEPASSNLKGSEWASLPVDSVVVDVGGGVGTASLALAKSFPDLKVIVQDLPPVVEDAKQIWKNELPDAIDSGRVILQAHDFFAPQPIKNASVFLLKQIIHNWSNAYASKILSNLREVASKDTTLIVIDDFVSYACRHSSDDNTLNIPGTISKEAPEPLLANYGIANDTMYIVDLIMLATCNSQKRTVPQFVELLQKSGWRLTKIVRNSFSGLLHAVPII